MTEHNVPGHSAPAWKEPGTQAVGMLSVALLHVTDTALTTGVHKGHVPFSR
jgi:hypothetical protein